MGFDRGQFDYLMPERLRVGASEGLTTAATGRGFAWNFFIGRQQGAVVGLVSGLGTTATSRARPRRRAFDVGCIRGWGPRGILRVLAETGVEIGNLLTQVGDFRLEFAEESKESGLGGGRNQIPKLLGNGGLLRHGFVVGSNRRAGHVSGREGLLLPRRFR